MPTDEACDDVAQGRRADRDRLVAQDPAQICGKLGGGGIAKLGLLGQRVQQDEVDVAAQRWLEARGGRGSFLFDGAQLCREGAAGKIVGQALGEQLVAEHAQRIDIRAEIDPRRIAAHLLGAHVGERADELTCHGAGLVRLGPFDEASDPKIQHAHPALAIDEHVVGLEVAVDHAVHVRVMDGVAELRQEPDPRVQIRARDLRQRHAIHELHCEVHDPAALVSPRPIDPRDARMLEPAECFDLVLEARAHVPGRPAALQHLERDTARGALLLGFVDDAHAAFADAAQHAVGAELLADQRALDRDAGALGGHL
jgi:hypothetical protein